MIAPGASRSRLAVALLAGTLVLAAGPPAPHTVLAQPGAFPGVPAEELDGYEILFQLTIPAQGPGYHGVPVPYEVDRGATFTSYFDRVAYHLRLEEPGAPEPRMVWASMAAFTSRPQDLALPTAPRGVSFQRGAADLRVYTNVAGLPRGPELGAAHLELWPHNYAPVNGAAVPGASGAVYDTGDQPVDPVAGYGSFQAHHPATGTTLLAWNRWGMAGPMDLGIGNSTGDHPDWTFLANSAGYLRRTWTVLVRPAPEPALRLEAPLERSVHQRDATNRAAVPIQGHVRDDVRRLEARTTPLSPEGGALAPTGAWRTAAVPPDGRLSEGLPLEAGWHALELRALDAGGEELGRTTVRPIGVGEVFVTAGQSNSANHGQIPLSPADPRVSALGPDGWRRAADPQPIATGAGGSPWPPLGDRLAAALDVPIGFISVGWGGTRVDQWQPGGTLYPRLRDALDRLQPNGARAVLWHQGESDTLAGTDATEYAERLQTERRAQLTLTIGQCCALVARARPDLSRLLRAGLYTGCRISEVYALQARDVQRNRPALHVGHQKTLRNRFVTLSPEAHAFFLELASEAASETDILLKRDNGRPWYQTIAQEELRNLVRACSLSSGVRFHTLRHTHASHLIAAGADPISVARQMGHASVRTVLQTYTHCIAEPVYAQRLREIRVLGVEGFGFTEV